MTSNKSNTANSEPNVENEEMDEEMDHEFDDEPGGRSKRQDMNCVEISCFNDNLKLF